VNFEGREKVKDLQRRLQAFLDEYIYPNEQRYRSRPKRQFRADQNARK
jgi:hypothetical protein